MSDSQPPQPIDEAELVVKIKYLIQHSGSNHRVGAHSDDWGGDSDNPCFCGLELNIHDTISRYTAQAVTAALKRVDEALPKLLTEQLYKDIKREYPDLDKTDYFHFGLNQAHQAITNELSKWEEAK